MRNYRAIKFPVIENKIHSTQAGGVLLTTLVMLLLIMAITLAAIKTAFLQEALAGNLRDREIAFQAAELALREAEAGLVGISIPATGCERGLCVLQSAINSVVYWSDSLWRAQSAVVASAPAQLASAPLYVIEQIPTAAGERAAMEGSGVDAASLNLLGEPSAYRITANAVGLTSSVRVLLQTTYLAKPI